MEEHYRVIYYEALDLVVEAIVERFNQPGYKVLKNLEQLLLKVCKNLSHDEELDFVCNFY